MRKVFRLLLIGLIFFGSARFSIAATTADFLKLGVGARPVAMGEAYAAVSDDANALYWNPAGLARTERSAATFMHAPYLESTSLDYAAAVHNFGAFGSMGVAVQYFSFGSVTGTDANNLDTGSFSPHDMAASLGYAHGLFGFLLGANAKYVKSTLQSSASTMALDLGVLTPALMSDRLRFGFAAVNLGGQLKFDQEKEDLPSAFRAGAAFNLMKPWLFSADVVFPKDDNAYFAVGTEYSLQLTDHWALAPRAGYNNRSQSSGDGLGGPSFGFGITYQKISVDYAFVPFGSLGSVSRVSVGVKF